MIVYLSYGEINRVSETQQVQVIEQEVKVSCKKQQDSRSAALRANLHRRKAQARHRKEQGLNSADVPILLSRFEIQGDKSLCL